MVAWTGTRFSQEIPVKTRVTNSPVTGVGKVTNSRSDRVGKIKTGVILSVENQRLSEIAGETFEAWTGAVLLESVAR